jgi:hypothetical protein
VFRKLEVFSAVLADNVMKDLRGLPSTMQAIALLRAVFTFISWEGFKLIAAVLTGYERRLAARLRAVFRGFLAVISYFKFFAATLANLLNVGISSHKETSCQCLTVLAEGTPNRQEAYTTIAGDTPTVKRLFPSAHVSIAQVFDFGNQAARIRAAIG